MNYRQRLYMVLVYGFLYLPLLVMIVSSFINHGQFSLTWYQQLVTDNQLWSVTGHSLLLAVLTASLATLLGTIAAYVMSRYRFKGRELLNVTLLSYIIIPDLLIGVSLLVLFHWLHITTGLISLLIGQVTMLLPFVTIAVNSRLLDLDQRIFQAAEDLGASEFQLFIKITLPLLITAIISAWILCFTLSMDDVLISFFLAGPKFQVLPLYIYSLVHLGVSPEINAICSLLFFVSFALLMLARKGMKL